MDSVSATGDQASAIQQASVVQASPDDWPWWRGPTWDGHARNQDVPIQWSETENIIWKIPIPGRGHASPIVVEDRVYIATADEDEKTKSLLCFRRDTGEKMWENVIHEGGFMFAHQKNSQASATPAWDGQHVICAFMVDGGIFVTAVDRDGQQVWQTQAGPFKSKHGYGASPLIYRSLVIVNGDNEGSGFVAALDRQSGDIVWRISRPHEASFATPIVASLDGRDQLLLSGHEELCAYNPIDGQLLWRSEGPATTTANSVAWYDDLVFTSGGWPQQNLFAVKADGSSEVVWQKRLKTYVPSPLVIDDRILLTQDNNILRCFRAVDGEELWTQRLGRRGFSASPTLVGDVAYLPDEAGNVFVFRPGTEFELLAENSMDGDGMASPVICGGRIYLRSSISLYCIGHGPALTTTTSLED